MAMGTPLQPNQAYEINCLEVTLESEDLDTGHYYDCSLKLTIVPEKDKFAVNYEVVQVSPKETIVTGSFAAGDSAVRLEKKGLQLIMKGLVIFENEDLDATVTLTFDSERLRIVSRMLFQMYTLGIINYVGEGEDIDFDGDVVFEVLAQINVARMQEDN